MPHSQLGSFERSHAVVGPSNSVAEPPRRSLRFLLQRPGALVQPPEFPGMSSGFLLARELPPVGPVLRRALNGNFSD